MYKCLKILIEGQIASDFLRTFIQKQAKKFELEGTAQLMSHGNVCVIVCGQKENVDQFIDIVHLKAPTCGIEHVEIEPFVKGKDYRGVFRVIE